MDRYTFSVWRGTVCVPLFLDPDFLVERIAQLVGGPLEFAETLPERPSQLGQLAGSENNQGNRQDDDQLRHADRTKHIANP
jgi:hypothetical protein